LLSPFTGILQAERDRTVPPYMNLGRYLGGLTIVFFCLEIVTGILLMIYYRPSMGAAHLSTGVIIDEVNLGWLVRSLHRRGADLLLLLAAVHLTRVYLSRAYENPRQLTWAAGILLSLMFVAFDLTGVLLPWDQYAYWSTDFFRQSLASIPIAGHVIVTILWGGPDLAEAGLLRFYAFHIAVLPWVALFILSFHLFTIWRFGLKPPAKRETAGVPILFYPDFLVDFFIAFLITLGLLMSAAIVFPARLGPPADSLTPLVGVAPRWYLMPLHQLLEWVSSSVAAVLGGVALLVAFFLPALDAGPADSVGRRNVRLVVGMLVVAACVLLGAREYFF
jgi:quinol-cytochrome oxidoreductase complex cytochrome b subunit